MPAGLLVLALAVTTGCGAPQPRENEDVPPQLTFESLHFRVYSGAVMTAEGDARRAAFRRDTSDLAAEGIDVTFQATPERPEARVTATRAHGNLRQRWVLAEGGVEARQAGQVGTTERARYDGVDGLIRGDRPVRIRSERFSVGGPAFTLDPRDQRLTLEGGARLVTGDGLR